MNSLSVKALLYFILMSALLVMAFVIQDKKYALLMAALSIITGSFASRDLASQDTQEHE